MQPVSSFSSCPLLPGCVSRRRYIQDDSDDVKVYGLEDRCTEVQNSLGYTLRIPDSIQNQRVVKDLSETRLHQLARSYVLCSPVERRANDLYQTMLQEFREEAVRGAVQAVRAEREALLQSNGATRWVTPVRSLPDRFDRQGNFCPTRIFYHWLFSPVVWRWRIGTLYTSVQASRLPLLGYGSGASSTKRYLRDYPKDRVTYDPQYGVFRLKDSSGYPIEISRLIQDRVVLEDSSEPKLQQLARRYVLGPATGPAMAALHECMLCQFGERATDEAIKAAFDEKRNLYPLEAQAFARDMMEIIDLLRRWNEIDRMWEANTHWGPDGLRCWNIPPKLSLRETLISFREDASMIHAHVRDYHPVALRRIKVAGIILTLFFLTFTTSFLWSRASNLVGRP